MKKKSFNCILCPLSCRIKVILDNNTIKSIKGYKCPRGKEYIIQEITNPVRILTTTIRLVDSKQKLVSVKTDKPIPKNLLLDAMNYLAQIEVRPPIEIGQILVENLLDTGANIIATTKIER